MAASLHNIFIFVTDVPRAKGFYVDQLGLPLAGENEMMLEFFPGAATTMSVALALQDDAVGMVGRHTGITLKIDGLEAVCRTLSAAGTAFVVPYEATPWGKMAVVADPDGNQIRLWER
jgi:predicted enzyme related to lactoylglutathione lyase